MKFINEYNINNVNEEVTLYGWIAKIRDLGGVLFLDLRDRSGIMQLVLKKKIDLKNEYVVKVKGKIAKREKANKNIATGEIEVIVEDIKILNESKELPFSLSEDTSALEDTRLKYRYLDLRRNSLVNNLVLRHKICMVIRNFLDKEKFIEVETPVLCKSTPEGARDYLVPSRIFKGKFYALPQSPQIFKQLLMIGGIGRYFQIARCFRDEDLRADRQPEFSQVDIEMSFIDEDDIISLTEKLIAKIFKEVKGIDIKLPLLRMKYDDAIKDYGSDKPDLRFDMKINDITDIFKNTSIEFLKNTMLNCLVVKNSADKYSRKQIDLLNEYLKNYKVNKLISLKIEDTLSGSIVKNMNNEEINNLIKKLSLENNDLVLILNGEEKSIKIALGALRLKLGKDLNLIDEDIYKLLWVVDFPSFEYSVEEKRYTAMHHPFTAVKDSDIDKLLTDKAHCYSKAYDIVINGYEAGGGSIRIHDQNIQKKMFEALELSEEDIENKFGFFIEALKYGTPPHGGLALGLDRLTMLLANTNNIKDVIAFPKTQSASDLMSESPSRVDEKQLKDLGIKIDE